MKKFFVGCTAAMLAVLSFSSIAMAAGPHHLTGEYAQFSDCPLSRPSITDCLNLTLIGGSLTLGKRTLPVANPIKLQGGFEGAGDEIKFFGAEDGDTLSKTPQPVPGGLLELFPPPSWSQADQEKYNEDINKGFTGLTATVEIAGPDTSIKLNTENLLFEEGVAMQLPVKIKLDNRQLGSNCYIGSDSDPTMLNLTSGTTSPPPPNQPIQGGLGPLFFNPEFTVLGIDAAQIVDNAFAVQGTNGCSALVNAALGTPSPAGRNAAALVGMMRDGSAEAVRGNEESSALESAPAESPAALSAQPPRAPAAAATPAAAAPAVCLHAGGGGLQSLWRSRRVPRPHGGAQRADAVLPACGLGRQRDSSRGRDDRCVNRAAGAHGVKRRAGHAGARCNPGSLSRGRNSRARG
jgi:hypothetical protein